MTRLLRVLVPPQAQKSAEWLSLTFLRFPSPSQNLFVANVVIVVAVVVATPRLLRLFDIPTLNSRERSAYKSVFSGAKE